MIVTLVSQCEKKALGRTRRILDAFANRIGDNVWQTAITEEGLKTVKQLLRSSATKSTAVSCHRNKTRQLTELVWIVGNKRRFNEVGVVAVNWTRRSLLNTEWEDGWNSTQFMATVSGIAGLFHDLGKANDLFQKKLDPKINTLRFEPYRHEWVSLRLFEAFIKTCKLCDDSIWLKQLSDIESENFESKLLSNLITDSPKDLTFDNPMTKLPPLAKLVAWLIISHHKLPQYNDDPAYKPSFVRSDNWMSESFDFSWNSLNQYNSRLEPIHFQENWQFNSGLPISSSKWRQKAKELSDRALRQLQTYQKDNYLSCSFISHISRLSLMLADHYYSAQEPRSHWQDVSYKAYANTDRNTKQLKQHLDEHNIGVAHYAYTITKQLYALSNNLNGELPALDDDGKILRNGLLNKESSIEDRRDFKWQDDAFSKSSRFNEKANKQGFFGICMASTGKGKTLANARIMYALSDKNIGCRFSIALGLRSLTMQTGKALQDLLKVDEMDVATVIGSQAILDLNKDISKNAFEQEVLSACARIGSESLDIGEEDYEIKYDDIELEEGFLSKYFANNSKAQKLLHAPVLVSTIDHLIPATEGTRNGRQIVPMLRLLTSDLVLDEPDEFSTNDLPALTRLVNWAGMLGAKVLLSTASMPPDFAYALFDAYRAGRENFHQDTCVESMPPIVCGWFDEYKQNISEISDIKSYIKEHSDYVKKRCQNLSEYSVPLRKAKIIGVDFDKENLYLSLATIIQDNLLTLHKNHHQLHSTSQQALSIGLIRFANINPLVAIAKQLYALPVPADTEIHYCVYHSQYPLAQRAEIEKNLDTVLDRHETDSIWSHPSIKPILNNAVIKNHVFIVLATSVAEVGRDHDYDWAIAEPSSMRSLVQLAGRIQRHRKQEPITHNYYILDRNIRALQKRDICFTKPGFENKINVLSTKHMGELLRKHEYEEINAIPCIRHSIQPSPTDKLVDMEHLTYRRILFGDKEFYRLNAKNWWRYDIKWNSEMQRRTPFRQSTPDTVYCLNISEENPEGIWQQKNEKVSPHEYYDTDDIKTIDIHISNGNKSWVVTNNSDLFFKHAESLNKPLTYISRVYGTVRLAQSNSVTNWLYSPLLGIHKQL